MKTKFAHPHIIGVIAFHDFILSHEIIYLTFIAYLVFLNV